jgi:hypothetical protein
MDEEDGRLGPTVQQLGRFDVLTDASTKSLRHLSTKVPISEFQTQPFIWVPQVPVLRPGMDLYNPEDLTRSRPITNEVNHENVPGK